ncbi:MAG: 50S ribosomal protein L10 [Gammaproteobacteria bacterium]|nr:50S ribosomal protein L10 [Gammaproteobacteria bacterium]
MSLNLEGKKTVVADVVANISKAQTMVLAEYRGTEVVNMTKLRADARAKGVYLRVIKNTLARRIVEGTPFAVAQDKMVGPLIYSFSEDAVAAAKVVNDFAKGNDKFVIKAGAYNGKLLDDNAVKALANIPSKEVLLAQLVGLLQSPISRFARVLAAVSTQKSGPVTADAPADAPAAA